MIKRGLLGMRQKILFCFLLPVAMETIRFYRAQGKCKEEKKNHNKMFRKGGRSNRCGVYYVTWPDAKKMCWCMS